MRTRAGERVLVAPPKCSRQSVRMIRTCDLLADGTSQADLHTRRRPIAHGVLAAGAPDSDQG